MRRRVFAFDMDGVIYRGLELIDGAAEAVAAVKSLGLPVAFTTNNSRETPLQLAAKLQYLGIDAGPDEVISGPVVTLEYLNSMKPPPRRLLVMGAPELAAHLESAGFAVASWEQDERPDVVLVGVDYQLSYQRLTRATQAIMLHGAAYLAVNTDVHYPTPVGPMPGAGAIAAAISAVTGKQPVIIGKPSRHMFETVLRRSGAAARDLVVLGDTLESDVAGAKAIGATAVLVLTGTASRDEAMAAPAAARPDYVIDNLTELPFSELLSAT